jgi:copper transport protein
MHARHGMSAVLAAGALLLLVTSLFAHSRLLRSDPADGEIRADTVHVVRLWFSTPIDGTRDGIEISGPDGRRVDGRNARVSQDDPSVFEVPVDARRSGRYVVRWTVISADGHPVSGSLAFGVDLPADPDVDEAGAAAPDDPLWLEPVDDAAARVGAVSSGVARWLHLLALVLALGALVLRRLIAPRADAPPARRLWALAAIGAVLLLPAALLQLGAQAAAVAGSWETGLSRRVLEPLLGGRWGALWQIRFGLALLLVWLAVDGLIRESAGRGAAARLRLAGALLVGALLIAVTSLDGHAATTPPVALSVTADALHIAAAAAWIGGLCALTLGVMPALRPLPAAERSALLGTYVPRFSTLALTSVGVLVGTGIYQSWQLVGGVAALVGTSYGRVLLLKLGVVALLLVPAAFNRFVLKPRLRTRSAGAGEARRFGRLVAAESALGLVVVALAAWLTGIPPARGEAAAGYAGFTFEPPLEPPAIAVALDDGGVFDLAEQRGNAVLLFFGFTNCPDFCPMTLHDWRRVRELLGEEAGATRFVFLSVDPQRDSPRIAAEYARTFHPSFIGLAPDSAEVSRIESGFFLRSMRHAPQPAAAAGDDSHDAHLHGAAAAAHASGDYEVMHSTRYFLIDPAGQVRVMYAWDSAPEDVARDVRRILAER